MPHDHSPTGAHAHHHVHHHAPAPDHQPKLRLSLLRASAQGRMGVAALLAALLWLAVGWALT